MYEGRDVEIACWVQLWIRVRLGFGQHKCVSSLPTQSINYAKLRYLFLEVARGGWQAVRAILVRNGCACSILVLTHINDLLIMVCAVF